MRIGFDAKRAFCNERGLGNYSRNILDQLVEFYPENSYVLFTPKIKKSIIDKWTNGKKLKTIKPVGQIWKTFHPLWRSFALTKVIEKENLDLFHGLSHELPHGIEKLKIKKIVTIHDLIFLRYPEYFPWFDRQVYLKKFTHSVKVADVVIAIGEQTKRDIVEFLGVPENKIVIHYQSCHPSFYQHVEDEVLVKTAQKFGLVKGEYILNVGAFEERKNQKNLIKAFKILVDKNPLKHRSLKLVLVGKGGQYLKDCRQMVIDLGLSDRVHFLQGITNQELPIIYQASKMFVFPSFFEGFGIPLIEAMFSRVPVITSFGSCFPEVAGPDSWYLDPYKPEDIERVIHEVLDSDLKEIQKRVEKSYEFVQKFHCQNTTSQLVDIYSQLIQH